MKAKGTRISKEETTDDIVDSDNPSTSVKNGRPLPGSLAWLELRKENHKNVERRRRETINMAMKELMDVIPGNEKNKSRVIARAVDYIQTLNHEKGSLRKDLDHYQALCVQYEREIADLKNGREPVTPRPSSTTS